ncbi:MAG: zinc ABC transporter substrate-binding protein [Oscillospiraceae bacterium]|nr:zinc ABC transporter substrate-binding protein [Oscillospiraceae bacterium]
MKKLCLFLIVLSLLLCGCGKNNDPQIVASTLPVYEFTSALCQGTGISVSRLITEEVSCLHDYTLQVTQMQAVEAADVVILNGGGLEDFLGDVLKNTERVIDASKDVELICAHHHEGHDHAHDPHIWLSPEKAKLMSRTICEELSKLYPAHKDRFESNLSALIAKLDALQAYGEAELSNLKNRNLITFHDGFSYFAESFDLHILKAVEEESGSEASAKELIEIIDLVKVNDLSAIFTECNGSTAAAKVISAETGSTVYELDMAMAGDSYFDAMYHNIRTVKEALG